MNDERRRVVGRHMIDGRNIPTNFQNALFIRDRHKVMRLGVELREIEGGPKTFQNAAAERVLAGLPVVEKIGRWKQNRNGLYAAAFAIDRVCGFGVALIAGGGLHQRKMTAGRSARDADRVGVDAIVRCMMTDKTNRAV